MNKPFSPSCERNQQPILQVLQSVLPQDCRVLEVGSGTGQHAVYFAKRQPGWVWRCSDLEDNLAGIQQWLDEAKLSNLLPPMPLNASKPHSLQEQYDAVFSANTLHIMAWEEVAPFFHLAAAALGHQAHLIVYGPFNYNGEYSSDSNAQFDIWLKQQAPHRSIRDFEAVNQLAHEAGFELIADQAMPANNRCLIWQKQAGPASIQ